MLTKLILLTQESYEKLIKDIPQDITQNMSEDWYALRQNMQKYLALKRQTEREASENRRNDSKKEDPVKINKRLIKPKKETINREVQTDSPITLPPSITELHKRKHRMLEQDEIDDDDDTEVELTQAPKRYRSMKGKMTLRPAPKRRQIYQHGKYYNVLKNWHCF